jgi:hypothetical protein
VQDFGIPPDPRRHPEQQEGNHQGQGNGSGRSNQAGSDDRSILSDIANGKSSEEDARNRCRPPRPSPLTTVERPGDQGPGKTDQEEEPDRSDEIAQVDEPELDVRRTSAGLANQADDDERSQEQGRTPNGLADRRRQSSSHATRTIGGSIV